MKECRHAVGFVAAAMLLFGGAYPVLLWGIGRTAFAKTAEGSLIVRADGAVAGSRLIAQGFTQPYYFHPRPSGVDYNAASPGGTNYGPSNPDHVTAVQERLIAVMRTNGVAADQVPSELVTASGAGLDPHLSPAAVDLQVARVAAARGVSLDRIRALVRARVEPPALGLFGSSRINVLELNLDLDASLGSSARTSRHE